MAWDTQMVTVLRVLVGDLDSSTYTDANLKTILVVSAFQVSREAAFAADFTVDITALSISPDPTDDVTRDDSFVNLVCMKSACLLDRGEARVAAQQGIAVRDVSSSVDLRGIAQAKLKLLEKGGWCSAYEDAKLEYLAGQVRVAGAAVMTPFRLYADGGGYYVQVPGYQRGPYY